MKVIFDTNILVSAVLKDKDPERVIQFVVDHQDFDWIATSAILTEYKEVLARPKFRLPREVRQEWENLFDIAVTLVEANIVVDFPADPKDSMLLACAVSSNADFLITGDIKLLQAKIAADTSILTVASFKELFCEDPLE
jgi:putative PIN family toxin of toxin-antitoxin system